MRSGHRKRAARNGSITPARRRTSVLHRLVARASRQLTARVQARRFRRSGVSLGFRRWGGCMRRLAQSLLRLAVAGDQAGLATAFERVTCSLRGGARGIAHRLQARHPAAGDQRLIGAGQRRIGCQTVPQTVRIAGNAKRAELDPPLAGGIGRHINRTSRRHRSGCCCAHRNAHRRGCWC